MWKVKKCIGCVAYLYRKLSTIMCWSIFILFFCIIVGSEFRMERDDIWKVVYIEAKLKRERGFFLFFIRVYIVLLDWLFIIFANTFHNRF